jgi:DNA-binding PadR family transcriptional regulator
MRYPFLALLASGPAHGYELRQALVQRFGDALSPINAGQVYTTLARLERDGLVRGSDVPDDSRQKRVYDLTAAGRAALEEWLAAPTPGPRLRDQFFMKLVLARQAGVTDPRLLIERQRREYLQALRDLAAVAPNGNNVASLLVEGAALHLEADLKWLDLCEERLIEEEQP